MKRPVLFLSVWALLLSLAAFAAETTPKALTVAVTDHTKFPRPAVVGHAVFGRDGVSFNSSEYLFSLPISDIRAIELKGARIGFLTIVLDSKSSFIQSYQALLERRLDSYGQDEYTLPFNLGQRERLDAATSAMTAYSAYVAGKRNEAVQTMIGKVDVSAEQQQANPFMGRTVRVFLQPYLYSDVYHGFLTFFADRVEFNSQDVNFALAYKSIQLVECAGTRETFLRISLNRRDRFAELYAKYLGSDSDGMGGMIPVLRVHLEKSEEIQPAFQTAKQFQQYVADLATGRVKAMIGSAGTPKNADLPAESQPKHQIARFSAKFIEKYSPSNNPFANAFKTISGIKGELIVFDTGLGYVSDARNPVVNSRRAGYLDDGYLRFFVPKSAILGKRDASTIRSRNNSSLNNYIVEVEIDRSSKFFREYAALLTESKVGNVIYFEFESGAQLARFLDTREQPKDVF